MPNSKLVGHAAVHVRWEETVEGEQFEGVRDVGNGYLKSG